MKPILQAFILADHVYQDGNSGKMIIAGSFSRLLRVRKEHVEPGQPQPLHRVLQAGSPFVYLNLVDAKQEKLHLELRWVALEDNRALFAVNVEVQAPKDPLDHLELIIPLPTLPTPHDGVFALELLINDGDPLGSWRVTVITSEKQEPGNEHSS